MQITDNYTLKNKKFAARFLDVSPETVARLVKAQKLCAIRVGGSVRFRMEDLVAYLERNASIAGGIAA